MPLFIVAALVTLTSLLASGIYPPTAISNLLFGLSFSLVGMNIVASTLLVKPFQVGPIS